MMTHTRSDQASGRVVGFEVDKAYISPSSVASLLRSVAGVSDVRERRPFDAWDDVYVRFHYLDSECKVSEPHDDSRRYWIGPEDGVSVVDLSAIETAFKEYQPPVWRRLLGSIVT